jgi:hypothetical protein
MTMFGMIERPLQPYPGCKWICRIDMLAGTRNYKSGEDFDLTAHGLVHTQALDLWRSGHLLVKPPQPAAPAVAPQKPAPRDQRARR